MRPLYNYLSMMFRKRVATIDNPHGMVADLSPLNFFMLIYNYLGYYPDTERVIDVLGNSAAARRVDVETFLDDATLFINDYFEDEIEGFNPRSFRFLTAGQGGERDIFMLEVMNEAQFHRYHKGRAFPSDMYRPL